MDLYFELQSSWRAQELLGLRKLRRFREMRSEISSTFSVKGVYHTNRLIIDIANL